MVVKRTDGTTGSMVKGGPRGLRLTASRPSQQARCGHRTRVIICGTFSGATLSQIRRHLRLSP